jgi:DNA-binding GntR family transcriptional regulator
MSKADEIAVILEEAIVSGDLAPGSVLRQEQLSEQFGVSRTPVREALRRLAALDLVSFAGKRGVRVRAIARDELLESFTVRAALEGLAAELALPHLTARDLNELRQAERQFARLTHALQTPSGPDASLRAVAADWVHANDRFHDVYLEACGVGRLADAARNARRVFHGQTTWTPSSELHSLYSRNLEQHRAIVEAFSDRSRRVRRLVEQHILDSGQLLERALAGIGYGAEMHLGQRASWAMSPLDTPGLALPKS